MATARNGSIQALTAPDGGVVAGHVVMASSPWSRFKGLMGVGTLPEGHGIALVPCASIHMFFMRIPLDAAFLDRDGRVLRVYHHLRPWRVTRHVRGARQCVELPAGTLAAAGVRSGDVLRLRPVEIAVS